MTATVDDRSQIHRALRRLRDDTGVPLAFGGPVDASQQVLLTEFSGPITGALRGVVLGFGRGLGGKVVAQRRPILVNDYVQSPGISHQYDHIIAAEGLRAMIAVPVIVGRSARGVLYGALRSAGHLGDRAVTATVDACRDLEQSLAVRDELTRRLEWLDQRTESRDEAVGGPRWELVREAYTELRVLTGALDDPGIRERFDAICAKLSAAHDPRSAAKPAPNLSVRELDVLACIALGWTNAEAATDLGLGRETVKSYLRSAMQKLGARSRLEAVVAARRHGLLP